MKKTPKTPAFKPYDQHQMFLFPPSIEEMIPENHPVRTLNLIFDRLNFQILFARYPGGGTSSYNPVMMIKVLVYAYLNNIYSSRRIEALLKENIHYMWLSGMQQPDHNTINRFKKDKLGETLKNIFIQSVKLLMEHDVVSIHESYLDGSKYAANANKYTVVWGKAIKTNKTKMHLQLKELWDSIQRQVSLEEKEDFPLEYQNLNAESLSSIVEQMNETLGQGEDKEAKELKKKTSRLRKEGVERLRRYEALEKLLAGRNSLSKTDPDATFMRLKEDYYNTRDLKPAYNVQAVTNKQIILDFGIFPNPTDTRTLPAMVSMLVDDYGRGPGYLIADAGYGSEENYALLENEGIQGVVKYNNYELFRSGKPLKKPYGSDAMRYDVEGDYVVCPAGEKMEMVEKNTRQNESGYTSEMRSYRAKDCRGCPVGEACHQGKVRRVVEISVGWRRLREKADKLLDSEKGKELYSRRATEIEPVFGNIKHNKGFRRFMLRGKKGVETEFGLLALSHNLKKVIHGGLLVLDTK